MKTTHEPLQPLCVDKLNFVRWQFMDIPTSSISVVIFCDGSFEILSLYLDKHWITLCKIL
jgi:hypothetical protein